MKAAEYTNEAVLLYCEADQFELSRASLSCFFLVSKLAWYMEDNTEWDIEASFYLIIIGRPNNNPDKYSDPSDESNDGNIFALSRSQFLRLYSALRFLNLRYLKDSI